MTYHYKSLAWNFEKFDQEFGKYLYMKYCENEDLDIKDFQAFMYLKFSSFRKLLFDDTSSIDFENEWDF